MKTDVITTVASNSAGMGSLQGIQVLLIKTKIMI